LAFLSIFFCFEVRFFKFQCPFKHILS
jgi:hypothetical protein